MEYAPTTREMFVAVPMAPTAGNGEPEGDEQGSRLSFRALWNATPRKRVNWCAVLGFGGAMLVGAATWTLVTLGISALL